MNSDNYGMFPFCLGYGTAQSDEEAIRWWTQAASAGSEPSAVRAMNTLAMVFSRPETCDMHKVLQVQLYLCTHQYVCTAIMQAFYWHSQAATNGHLESMGKNKLSCTHDFQCTLILGGMESIFKCMCRIVLMFRKSKFSQIAVFDNFIEKHCAL